MEIVQSQNILNWYPFEKNQDILELGGNLINLFCEKCNKVTIIEPNLENVKKIEEKENLKILQTTINETELSEKYDIITLIGTPERIKEIIGENISLEETIKILEKYLKPNGKILIAVDNKFGLKFFAGNPEKILNKKFESLIGYNNEVEKIETYTKSRLERILKGLGYNTRFYYPLPDYKLPNVIFSDEQLPKYNSVDKYNPYYTEKSDIIFNEIDVFREILKNDENMFTFFANSFLVEATKGECNKEYKYISFNNLRKEKYQLITKIADTYVEKQVVNENSKQHYENIENNIKILETNGIDVLDYVEDEKIKSRYIEQKYLLNNVLTEKLENNKQEEFENILNRYIDIINKNSYKETDYDKTVFAKYNVDIENKEIIENLHFLKNGLWDMTFKNCFLIDDKFLFFDQEWNEENLPAEYILYRSILYTISLRRFINIEDLLEKYDLTKYIELFSKLDEKLQEEIRDDETWRFYGQDHKFNIDDTKQEIINLNIRASSQEAAMKNLQEENEKLRKANVNLQESLNKTNIQLQETLNSTFSYRLKNILKKMLGGSDEQSN